LGSASVNSIEVKNSGTVRFHNVKVVQNSSKHLIAVSRSGEVGVVDDVTGREKERYKIPYGSEFAIKDGAKVNAGDTLATWDPHMHPVITEVAGKVKFTDFVEAVTVQHRVDEMTGLTTIEVMDDSALHAAGWCLRQRRGRRQDQGW
jgi:DNA-directed RNA polymerase subunit beta'